MISEQQFPKRSAITAHNSAAVENPPTSTPLADSLIELIYAGNAACESNSANAITLGTIEALKQANAITERYSAAVEAVHKAVR